MKHSISLNKKVKLTLSREELSYLQLFGGPQTFVDNLFNKCLTDTWSINIVDVTGGPSLRHKDAIITYVTVDNPTYWKAYAVYGKRRVSLTHIVEAFIDEDGPLCFAFDMAPDAVTTDGSLTDILSARRDALHHIVREREMYRQERYHWTGRRCILGARYIADGLTDLQVDVAPYITDEEFDTLLTDATVTPSTLSQRWEEVVSEMTDFKSYTGYDELVSDYNALVVLYEVTGDKRLSAKATRLKHLVDTHSHYDTEEDW